MAFPGELNINYYRGDTYEFNIYPKLAGGSAMDLTNYTVKFYIGESRGQTTGLNECYATIPTLTGGEDFPNYVKCAITPAAGALLDPTKTYYYDVEVTKASTPYPYVYTLLTGTVSITDQVSRPA
jgi:hypothetical protein